MKSEFLDLVSNLKHKNSELKKEVVNDYSTYEEYSSYPNNILITLTENRFLVEDGPFVLDKEVLNNNMLKFMLHNYLSKSIIKGKNAYRYDVFVFNDMEGNNCEKVGYLVQEERTTNQRAIVKCSSKQLASIIKEELACYFGYLSISEVMEKTLHI